MSFGIELVKQANSNSSQCLGNRAIIVGGSIAGLLSARVLSEYFQQVIILDRDKLPNTSEARRGVPQSVQPHVLLTNGQASPVFLRRGT